MIFDDFPWSSMMFHDVSWCSNKSISPSDVPTCPNGCSNRFSMYRSIVPRWDPASFPSKSLDPSDKVSIRPAYVEKWDGMLPMEMRGKIKLQYTSNANILEHKWISSWQLSPCFSRVYTCLHIGHVTVIFTQFSHPVFVFTDRPLALPCQVRTAAMAGSFLGKINGQWSTLRKYEEILGNFREF